MWRALTCLCKMSNPIRRLRLDNSNVLPFCYELALNNNSVTQPRATLTSTSAQRVQESDESKKQSIEQNPYYAKYADKIKKSQIKSSAANEKINECFQSEKPQCVTDKEPLILYENVKSGIENKEQSRPLSVGEANNNKTMSKSKSCLDDIVKLDRLKEKSREEIIEIWNAYHSKKDCIYSTIPTESYDIFYQNSIKYPLFILPLPRNKDQTEGGYEFFLIQFREHSCYFTPLAAYHLHKELAPVCLTIHHYPELSQSKNLVLMMGEHDSNVVNIMEIQCLANQLQYYYTTTDAAAQLSLHLFNKESKSFDHMRLIRHLEEGILSNSIGAINLDKQD